MNKDFVLQLRYVGVFPQIGRREYRFQIETKGRPIRDVVLDIDDGLFLRNDLMFQEAPDLCYQKLLEDLRNETEEAPIESRVAVTETDVHSYRHSHPNAKLRRAGSRR